LALSFMKCEEIEKKIEAAEDLLVYVIQEGCGRCATYLNEIELPDEAIAELPNEMVVLDANACPHIADRLGVEYTPKLVRVKKGAVVEEIRPGRR